MLKVVAASLSVALAAAPAGAGEPPSGRVPFAFMGVKVGQSPQEFLAAVKASEDGGSLSFAVPCGTETPSATCRRELTTPDGSCMLTSPMLSGIHARYASYDFAGGKLDSIFISVDKSLYGTMRDFLLHTYGKPAEASAVDAGDGHGATSHTMTWTFADGQLDYYELVADAEASVLTFNSTATLRRRLEDKEEAAAKAKCRL
jgi:hypothetical protein